MYRTLAAMLLVISASACAVADHPLEPASSLAAGEPWLRTDRVEYVIRDEGRLRAVDFELTYDNHLNSAVAVPTCHSPRRPVLEKLVGGQWTHVFSPVELMCITAPLVLAPRSTHRLDYALRADEHDVRRWLDSGDGTLDGTYRLVWFVSLHAGAGDGTGAPLPAEYRVSNTFRLERRPP